MLFEFSREQKDGKNVPDHITSGKAFSWAICFMLVASLAQAIMLIALGEENTTSPIFTYLGYFLVSLSLAITALVVFWGGKISPRSAIKIGFDKKFIPVIALVFIGSYFGLSKVNTWFIEFIKLFGYVEKESSLPDYSVWSVIFCTLFICLIPAVCEEILFRGIILKGLEKRGRWTAILISSLLFALYHQSPQQTVYQFCMGVTFGIIALSSGSVLPTVILHFLNNFIIVLWYYYFPEFALTGVADVVATVLGFIAVIGGLLLSLKFADGDANPIEKRRFFGREVIEFLLSALPGVAVTLVMWFAVLFSM